MPTTTRATRILLTSLTLLASALAQTSTVCNPLDVTCPADPALGTTFNNTFSSMSTMSGDIWSSLGSTDPTFPADDSGAAFTVAQHGDAPTVQSKWYVFWGHVSVMMRAAPGTGIISSIVLLSDDLDEIDWEVMGGNTTHVETNYYGKGNTTQMNSEYFPCDDPQGGFHNYTVNWDYREIQWILDGTVVRTVTYGQAVGADNKTMYPQTPMQLKIGSWAGGDASEPEGTREWAGGLTDYAKGPFTMTVQSVMVQDGQINSTDYTYSDRTGAWPSIVVAQ